ncbi:MAG: DHHA1 domain-containing protein, partial [Acidobacteriota bacterium]
EVARIKPPYRASHVGFRLGPRLNAPGRLGSAMEALELLMTRDPQRAAELASDLDAHNRERQSWERQAAQQAREHFAAQERLPAILVASNPEWHRGVVGIAAGRIAREFNRPTLLLAEEDGRAVGSGRSIRGLDLHGFLLPFKERLEKFGGHSQAIGMTVSLDELPGLLEEWHQLADREWADTVAIRSYEYELEMPASELDRGMLAQLESLEPFGQENPRPLLKVPGPLRLARQPRRFGQDHLEAELIAPDRSRIGVVGWGWAPRAESLLGPIEVLGHLEFDSYRGRPVLRLVDSRQVLD